ncbi:MAG: PTS sugar transporter subunit IIC, partial [Erysipelotrichaceae bacterium]|nr:PTS sugar transporter subunit IIC [Erysipelotrichaceae bacterium]
MTSSVSTLQALLLGLWVFWFKSTFHPNLFFYWSKPLTASLFVGLIMGDMKTALSAGISIQLIYIGVMGIGTSVTADTLLAT